MNKTPDQIIAEQAEEIEKLKSMEYLHQGDTIADATQFLSKHPELDMIEGRGETDDGEQFTVIILRGHQNHVEPLKQAKNKIDELRSIISELQDRIRRCYNLEQ